MPPANKMIEEGMLLRELFYGPPKHKKTWLAGTAAEAGFNVIFFDGDDGTQILKQIPQKARERIQVIDVVNTATDAVFARILTRFLTHKPFVYDETTKQRIVLKDNVIPGHGYYALDANKLTSNDVLVIDSWTVLAYSLRWRWYKENHIEISQAEQVENKNWDVYAWSGAMATWTLEQIKALPCHVIVVGHQTNWEKRNKDTDEIEIQRIQPVSTSGPHAMTIGQEFSDILYFKTVGSSIKIDTRVEEDRDGGSRIIPPKLYNWEELKWENICKYAGITKPEDAPPSEAAIYFDKLEDAPEGLFDKKKSPVSQVGNSQDKKVVIAANKPAKSTSLGSLLTKK